MRILILSNLDWPSVDALTRLRPQLMQDEVTVMLSKRVGRVPAASNRICELSQADRAGWMALLRLAGVPEDDLEETARSTLADVLACPVAFVDGINAPAGISRVQAFAPDLIVSIRFGEILRWPVIRSARFGVLNLHSGLLPAFRGVMATFWAMLGSAPRYGTTLHWIEDSGIDSGTIISESAQPLDLDKLISRIRWRSIRRVLRCCLMRSPHSDMVSAYLAACLKGRAPTSVIQHQQWSEPFWSEDTGWSIRRLDCCEARLGALTHSIGGRMRLVAIPSVVMF